jgi:hypothetical protein
MITEGIKQGGENEWKDWRGRKEGGSKTHVSAA